MNLRAKIIKLLGNNYAVFFCVLLANFLLYFNALNAGYFGDDYQFLFANPKTNVLGFFSNVSAYNPFYRPIQAAFLNVLQSFFGEETWPIHILHLLLQTVLIFTVYKFTARLGFNTWPKVISVIFLWASQASVHAIVSVDTTSMVGSTAFGFLSVYLLHRFYNTQAKKYFIISSLVFFTSLLFKESGVSFLIMIIALIFLQLKSSHPKNWAILVLHLSVYFVIFIYYFVLRKSANGISAQFAMGTYGFSLGFNTLVNYFYLIVASTLPISSAHFYKWFVEKDYWHLVFSLLFLIPYYILLVYSIIKGCISRSSFSRILLFFYLMSFIPVVLLNHVSELYAYNAMPFLALIIGFSFNEIHFFEDIKKWKGLIHGFLVLVLVVNIWSVNAKTELMRANGLAAKQLVLQLKPILRKLPENSKVYLVNSCGETQYSVFFQNEYNLFNNGLNVFSKEMELNSLTVKIIDQSDIRTYTNGSQASFYRISTNNQVELFIP